LLAFLVLCAQAAPAQDTGATLRGQVSNGATGQNLSGATVTVVGGSQSTITADDGSYVLSRLPSGPVKIEVTYPGLDHTTAEVSLVSGRTTLQNVVLDSQIYELAGITVIGIREGNAAAIARQEQSLTVVSKVSTDAYGNIAKGDMGSFLQRLPGIVGEYGGSAVDAVLVRGLSQEFTTVTLDGTRAASANPDSRSQLVSSLPADSIESVEVIKTPTADMDGDSLGGVVNLRPRSGFDRTGRMVVLNASTSYNDTFGKHMNPSKEQRFFPQFSGQYGDVFTIGDRNLGVSLTGTYQEVAEAPSTVRAQFASDWDYVSPSVGRRVVYADQEFHLNKRAGLNSMFDYKLSPDSSVSFSASFNRFNNYMEQNRPQYQDSVVLDKEASTPERWVFSRVRYRTGHDFREMDYGTLRLKLDGRHRLGGFDFSWDASYEKSERDLDRIGVSARSPNNFSMVYDRSASTEFPTITYTGGTPPPADPFTNLSSVALTATHEFADNTVKSARMDLLKELPDGRFPMKLKTGVRVREEGRSRDAEVLSGTAPAGDYSKYRLFDFTHGWVDGRYPATPIFDTKLYFADAGVAYNGGKFTYNSLFPYNETDSITDSLQNDYRTKETIPAVYVQGEIDLTRQLKATLGVRYEQTKTELTSRAVDEKATTPAEKFARFQTVTGDYGTWFPNVQFRYEPLHRLVFRAAYSTTIGRPRLSDLVARFSVNEENQSISFANSSLKPQKSQNFDLSAEFYFEPSGVVSVGVFRKELTDFVTRLTQTITGNEFGLDLSQYVGWEGTTNVNSGKGTVEGIEFNYSQQFTFLPGFLNDFGAMANWTILTSEGDYNGLVTNLPFKNTLTGMRPRSGNAGLTYVTSRWDLRLMWNYADSYLVGLNTSDPSSSDFIGARQQWDFFARFNITEHWNLFVDVINLGNDHRSRYQGLVAESRHSQTNLFSRSITAGVQLRF
jgi:TonB-dependent receptor